MATTSAIPPAALDELEQIVRSDEWSEWWFLRPVVYGPRVRRVRWQAWDMSGAFLAIGTRELICEKDTALAAARAAVELQRRRQADG